MAGLAGHDYIRRKERWLHSRRCRCANGVTRSRSSDPRTSESGYWRRDYRSLFIHVERSVALFWTAGDLENRLQLFQDYFNRQRVHSGFGSATASP